MSVPRPPVAYEERLLAPVSWWLLAALLVLSTALAIGLYLGPAWGGLTVLVGALAVAAILGRSAVRVAVTPAGLRVGRNLLESAYVGDCRALTAEETQRRSGPDADARAFLLLRPFVPTAVEVAVDDPVDPVPYWLISSRHPDLLAAALDAARHRSGTP